MKMPDYSRNMLRGFWITCILILAGVACAYATHLRAGNIILTRKGPCSERTYMIRVIVYTKTESNVLFGGDQDYLDFGDGSPRILIPEVGPGDPHYTSIDADRAIASAYFEIPHTFPGPDTYTISYVEPNRNENVLNMDNSVNTTFYLETQIIIDPFLGCSTPADLLIPPVDRACAGVTWTHNPGAVDLDGDLLTYEMVVPYRDRDATVLGYKAPNDPKFYTNYGTGNEAGTGPPTFSIDSEGTITWDAPGAVGEYNIAFIVRSWKEVLGVLYPSGFVRRDMQIIVEECQNERPDLEIPEDVCIEAGETLNETIFGTDPDNDEVKIEAISDIFNFTPAQSPATFSPRPAVFQPSTPPAELDFQWQTTCDHVKELPYQVVFKITDRRGGGLGLATYKIWRIRVVGPAPTWSDASLDVNKRSATIKWDPYFCANAQRMEIWRKVDSTAFKPDTCQTGMPEFLGYQKIAEQPINGSSIVEYVDDNLGKGLAPGAMYCYRLVAVFPLPRGGESYVSRDTCVGPILADVPIITHVTVDKTGLTDGQITVSWKKPYEADPIQYPPPFQYRVYRAEGYVRGSDSTLIFTLNSGDTTYMDGGLNTEEKIYNYSITAYSPSSPLTEKIVGSSEAASSVRLESKSKVTEIELNWAAVVPWSNQIQSHPRHLIYRGPEGASENELILIDSVDATIDGLRYVDQGKFNNTPLEPEKVYCYRILTRGGYGNPNKIDEPLENFSQKVCIQLGDTIFPCKPTLSIALLDCEKYINDDSLCTLNSFSNELTWNSSTSSECQSDIRTYNIYRAATPGGTYVLLKSGIPATITTYKDEGLPSFARCYKISSVDRSGNESELSNEVCNDNCPYYELPNVFSPNGDDKNDDFSAFNIRDYVSSCETCPPVAVPDHLQGKCARFVQKVTFKVFNRWGQKLYSYESGSENTIYIDWNGKDENGSNLASGVYYYVAEVTFDVLNTKDKVRTYKGWVHLLHGQQ